MAGHQADDLNRSYVTLDKSKIELDQQNLKLEIDKFELEKRKHEFEILKTLHDAGLARWKDRRENEWKLNYAIWAAIAGLDALLLHDQNGIKEPNSWLWAGGIACFVLHLAYLWPTISRAIGEIKMQSNAEHAMRMLILDTSLRNEMKIENLGGRIDRFQKLDAHGKKEREGFLSQVWKHYGLVAPLCFTVALLVVGGLLLSGHGKGEGTRHDNATVVKCIDARSKP